MYGKVRRIAKLVYFLKFLKKQIILIIYRYQLLSIHNDEFLLFLRKCTKVNQDEKYPKGFIKKKGD